MFSSLEKINIVEKTSKKPCNLLTLSKHNHESGKISSICVHQQFSCSIENFVTISVRGFWHMLTKWWFYDPALLELPFLTSAYSLFGDDFNHVLNFESYFEFWIIAPWFLQFCRKGNQAIRLHLGEFCISELRKKISFSSQIYLKFFLLCHSPKRKEVIHSHQSFSASAGKCFFRQWFSRHCVWG